MRLSGISLLLALSAPWSVFAQSSASAASPVPNPSNVAELAAVTVSGVQPGPGLWKVSRGDHVMWVLGTLSPLPRDMQWQSRDVAEVISQSQQVLLSPSIKVKADVGFFGKVFLLPLAYSARKNADGKTLDQVLPSTQYARWLVLKQQYLGRDHGIERWRPIFAAQELYNKALKANGLTRSGQVEDAIKSLARQNGVEQTPVQFQITIEDPRAALKTFKKSQMDEASCFGSTLDSIEQDMPAMRARANAWSGGDMQSLRELPNSQRHDTCVTMVAEADFAHKLGFDDAPQQLEKTWLDAAKGAIQRNTQTLALLPIDELLSPTGYLSRLAAAGYTVESPEQQDAEPVSGASTYMPAAATSIGVP